jgi:glutamine synthetase
VARKAVNYMKSTGVADAAMFGPSLEFFVFDDVRFDQTSHSAFYAVDSAEGQWNTGRDERPNTGYKIPYKQGYFPCPPSDSLHDLRSEMMLAMMQCGMTVESHHHEKAGGGQCAINVRYDDLVPMADNVLKYKYIVKNVARRHGKAATFMPKPLFEDYGSGHARPRVAVEGQGRRPGEPVRRQRLLGAVGGGPVRARGAAEARPRRCARSPTRRRTATSGWCPGTRRR